MKPIPIDAENPEPEAVARAVEVLRSGGIVAFPTETVYGICADATNPAAVRRLYEVKGRDPGKACAYLLPDRKAAERLAPPLPPMAARIADRFWPGPVTLVVPGARPGDTVGLRLPALELPRALADIAGKPLLQTSANRSGEPAPLDAAGVVEALGEAVDLILDGGRAPGGQSSSVVACDGRSVTVLRAGAVPAEEILRAASELTLVVCTGNLCRSPLAAALLERALAARLACAVADLPRFGHRVDSFGTMAVAGRPATEHAITIAREMGVDLTAHRSRPFSLAALAGARRSYGLARPHIDFLLPYYADRPNDLALLDPKGREIHDPYGLSLKVYRRVGRQIRAAVERRADELAGAHVEGSGGGRLGA